MRQTRTWITTGLLGLLLTGCILGSAGCTTEHLRIMETYGKNPPGYDDYPLGAQYDTPAKVSTLTDAVLIDRMTLWFQERERYASLWHLRDPNDPEVRRALHAMLTLKTCIQDRVRSLVDAGVPL